MIIPIKCFTCGFVLADKYQYFCEQVKKIKLRDNKSLEKVEYLTNEYLEKNKLDKTPEGTVLDEIDLTNPCCRRHILTHVNIE